MSAAIGRILVGMVIVLVLATGGPVAAQQVELKAQVLGTGYDKEAREITGQLPADGAVVKRAKGVRVFCLTAFNSDSETSVYHLWLYRGTEAAAQSAAEPRALFYDSVTKETTSYSVRDVLDRTEDLRELTDVRAIFIVKLRVGKSSYWRTYSNKRIDFVPSAGTWECRIYNADEELLGKKTFTVSAD